MNNGPGDHCGGMVNDFVTISLIVNSGDICCGKGLNVNEKQRKILLSSYRA